MCYSALVKREFSYLNRKYGAVVVREQVNGYLRADGRHDGGFAIVTDDPPVEVSEAGHDRCPVILEPEDMPAWLHQKKINPEQLLALLGNKKRVTFRHKLAEAA